MIWRVRYRCHISDPWQSSRGWCSWAGAWWEMSALRADGWVAEIVRGVG